jgi:hypothetical protein
LLGNKTTPRFNILKKDRISPLPWLFIMVLMAIVKTRKESNPLILYSYATTYTHLLHSFKNYKRTNLMHQ